MALLRAAVNVGPRRLTGRVPGRNVAGAIMSRVPMLLAAALLAACARPAAPPAAAPPDAAPAPAPAPAPGTVGTITVLEVVMPEPGTTIGEQYAGTQFAQRVGTMHMTEAVARRWSALARSDAEAVLRLRGYSVRSVALPTSDAARADEVRFALTATVQRLAIRTEGRNAANIEATAVVGWELLDLAAGSAVFGRQTEGVARDVDTAEVAARAAFQQALAVLLADSAFLAVIQRSRSEVSDAADLGEGYARRLPGPRDSVVLQPWDANVVPADGPVVRVAAGIVSIRARDGVVGTGFLITRDGLAVTRSSVARRGDAGLWARFPSGIQRRARTVRTHGRLALVQVACPDACRTVELGSDVWPVDGVSLMAVGAPADDREAVAVSIGTTAGGCGLFSGSLRQLDIMGGAPEVGEPLARADDGTVVAVVTRTGCASPLVDVLRSLRIYPGPVLR